MRDSLYDDVAARLALAPAVRLAATTVNGPSIDVAGQRNFFRVGMFVVLAGAITDGTHTIVLEDSDTGSGGWAPIAAGNLEGSPPALATAQANSVVRVAFANTRRYVRCSLTTAGATVGGTVGATCLLSSGSGRPVT